MSEIANISNSEKLDVGFDAWKLQEVNGTAIMRINLQPGDSIEEHVNEKTVVFYVLNGAGDLTIDGKVNHLQAGDSLVVENGRMRGWTVKSDIDLELLVVKFL